MHTTIPHIQRCLELMEMFAMWENIRHHSFKVAQVAVYLQENLMSRGIAVDRDLVIAGALLHDIAKSKCLDEGCRHAEIGGELMREFNYPEVAEIVANHVVLADFSPTRYGNGGFTAIDLVFYADKRVKHDQIVSLDERLDYILEKYANDSRRNEERILHNFSCCRILENHLFAHLGVSPDALPQLLEATVGVSQLCYPPTAT